MPANALQTDQGNNEYLAKASLKSGFIFPEPYCENAFPTGIFAITRVQFGDIDNASPSSDAPGHENFTAIQQRVQPGNSIPLRVEGVADLNRQFVVAYVDWNQDGVLYAGDEATELGWLADSNGSDGKFVIGDIKVPANARPGPTRMRVIKRTSNYSLACSRAYSGQAEDYTLIVGSGDDTPTLALAFDPPHVDLGVASRMTLTLSNPNASAATLSSDLVQTLPAGITVVPSSIASDCGAGEAGATTGSVTLPAGASIPAGGSCSISVDVLSSTAGFHTAQVAAGALSTSHGDNALAASASLEVGYAFPEPYCRVEYNTAVVSITRVEFAGFDNRTPATVMSGEAHEDFTHISGHVVTGDTLPILLEFVAFGTFENVASVYFDWNQDNVFDESESYHLGGLVNSSGLDGQQLLGTIQVPVDAKLGPTRMRVNKHQGGWMNGCNRNPEGNWNGFGGDGYGQSEDYTVIVTKGLAAPAVSLRFEPAMGLEGDPTLMTTTLRNVNAIPSTTTRPFRDDLPAGLEAIDASTTCAGASASFTAGTVTLGSGAVIPAEGSCELRATVRATTTGNLVNRIEVGDVTTSTGSNLAPATATYRASASYAFPEPYCPTYFQFAVFPITRVTFAGIDNVTSEVLNGTPPHEDFTSIQANVSRGGSWRLSVQGSTLASSDPSQTSHVYAFIDWNQDGVLSNDERYLIGHLTQSSGIDGETVSRVITVPANAAIGPTRMRISKTHDQIREACNMTGAGQAEDYTVVVDDLPSAPQLSVAPGELQLSTPQGDSAAATLDLANIGHSLLWYDLQGTPGAGGAARVSPQSVGPAAAKLEGAVLRTHLGANDGVAQPSGAPSSDQLGQMLDNAPEAGNGVSCTVGRIGTSTVATSWWRRFYLAEHPSVGAGFQVDAVTVASEIGPQLPATINVYTIPRGVPAETIDLAQLQLVGSGRGLVGGSLTTSRIPLYNTVIADAASHDLVVEYHVDDHHELFVPGGNTSPQTHSTFISAPGCGIPLPATGESLAFDEFHLVMLVDVGPVGETVGGCDTPSLVPWLGASPARGELDAGQSQAITLDADASALEVGLHQAKVCVESNDPANPRVEVPVTLRVTPPGVLFSDGFEAASD